MASTRRLAAILAADVAGYSRPMGAEEEGTLAELKAIRRELTRISQTGRCIGAPDLRKSSCQNGLAQNRGSPDANRV
jgi:hypothetical protein